MSQVLEWQRSTINQEATTASGCSVCFHSTLPRSRSQDITPQQARLDRLDQPGGSFLRDATRFHVLICLPPVTYILSPHDLKLAFLFWLDRPTTSTASPTPSYTLSSTPRSAATSVNPISRASIHLGAALPRITLFHPHGLASEETTNTSAGP